MTTAYKAFDANLQCRGFQFEVGKTYTHDGPVEACKGGFHACESPMDVWDYYPIIQDDGTLTRYAEVEVAGDISREGDKLAAAQITIKAELRLSDFVRLAVAAIIDATEGKSSACQNAQIGSRGDYDRIVSGGDFSKIVSDGNRVQISSSGYNAKIGSSGDSPRIVTSGHNSYIVTSGDYARIVSGGDFAKIGSSGDCARIGSSGDGVQIGSSGSNAQIGYSGDCARIGSSGDNPRIGTSGDYAKVDCSGLDAVVAGSGRGSRVRGKVGTWISLASFDNNGKCDGFGTGCIGQDGLEPDTWYRAEAGKLVKA